MATHAGRLAPLTTGVWTLPLKQIPDPVLDHDWNEQVSFEDHSKGTPGPQSLYPMPQRNIGGILPADFAEEFIYNRIWIYPESIDAGFIVEPQAYTVSVWNAFHMDKDFSALLITNPLGMNLTYDPPPLTMALESELLHELTVFKSGPPTQNTTIDWTVGGETVSLLLVGIRVIPFAYEPNWEEPVKLSLVFQTAISKSRRFVEQRRPLIPKALRKASARFLNRDHTATTLVNDLHYAQDKAMGVPVYTEPMHPTTNLTGNQIVTISESLTHYWHLQNLTGFVLLIDYANDLFELKELTDITGQNITFRTPVVGAFNVDTTVIYPVFIGVVQGISSKMLTDSVMETELEFREVKIG